MKPAAYRDIAAAEIPVAVTENGVRVKVIAGTLEQGGRMTTGPIDALATDPRYFDVILPAKAAFEAAVPAGHNVFLYAYEGEAAVGAERKPLPHRAAGLLSDGDTVRIEAGAAGARVLLLAGKPIGEPIVQYGPFVMNTREEIEQAIADYQSGEIAKAPVRRIKTA
jgi:redox-sensitive bicupin YhaK (pirin superfamily)